MGDNTTRWVTIQLGAWGLRVRCHGSGGFLWSRWGPRVWRVFVESLEFPNSSFAVQRLFSKKQLPATTAFYGVSLSLTLFIHMYIYIYIYVYAHIYIYVYIHIIIPPYIYIYKQIMHTYTYIYIYICMYVHCILYWIYVRAMTQREGANQNHHFQDFVLKP